MLRIIFVMALMVSAAGTAQAKAGFIFGDNINVALKEIMTGVTDLGHVAETPSANDGFGARLFGNVNSSSMVGDITIEVWDTTAKSTLKPHQMIFEVQRDGSYKSGESSLVVSAVCKSATCAGTNVTFQGTVIGGFWMGVVSYTGSGYMAPLGQFSAPIYSVFVSK